MSSTHSSRLWIRFSSPDAPHKLPASFITIKGAVDYYQQETQTPVPWDSVGIKKVDDYTLRIETTGFATVQDVKTQFSTKYTHLVHKPTWEACFSPDRATNSYGTPNGGFMSCGPFILKEWIEGSQFVFERNAAYVLADQISLEKAIFYQITDVIRPWRCS
jgi:oligopeptide transport system substrate-binding protein